MVEEKNKSREEDRERRSHTCNNGAYRTAIRKALTLNLLTTTIVAPPSNASKWQMGFNSAFEGLISQSTRIRYLNGFKNTNKIFLIIQSVTQLLKRSSAFYIS